MKKWVIVLLVVMVVVAAVVWFFVFRKSGQYAVVQAVPEDAVFVVETPSFNSIHENLRRNKIWASLKAYPAFEAYHGNLEYADSICNAHPVLKRMLTDRPFAVSCHLIAPSEYGFLYVCDLGKLNVIKAFEGALRAMLKDDQVRIVKRGEVSEVTLEGIKLYYAIKANLLIISFSEKLVQQSLASCHAEARQGRNVLSGDLMLHVNHGPLDKWMSTMLQSDSQSDAVPGALKNTQLALTLTDKSLVFKGETSLNRTNFSLLSALNLIDGGAAKVKKITGNHVAGCVSICFASFPDLENILIENYKANNLKEYTDYEQTLSKINKYLGVNVLELFTSWIGNEIAIIKPAVDKEKRLDNMAIAIHSKDIDLAKDQLRYLTEQIGRKTPIRFKSIEYNGHTISYISLKGFFNLFLGSLFHKFDRPYYTVIEDYVVFSNSPATLATMIKDYSLGNTLENDERYNALMDRLGDRKNVYGYVNTSDMYNYLYESFKPEDRAGFAKNKGAFLSFDAIGFTLVNTGSVFETQIIANHNVNAPEEFAVKELSRELEEFADEIESGYYYPVVPDSIAVSTRGNYSYQTDHLSFAGKLSNGNPDGIWEVTDKQGIKVAQLTWREGKPEGESRFFYAGGTMLAQVLYEKEKITAYKEFFPDGALKMEMEYHKGIRHGDIRFYYSTGHLRGEGKYRKGQRTGTWKYYRVTGEVDRKMKMK